MSVQDADLLQKIFQSQQSLTTWHEQAVQASIELYRALRENDLNVLRARAKWDDSRDYVPDPLAEKISEAFADMLFGEDPIFKSAETIAQEEWESEPATPGSQPPGGTASDDEADEAEEDSNDDDGDDDNELEKDAGPDEEIPEDATTEKPVGDQDRLENIITSNDLPSELRAAEVVCSSEGEVWWRIYVDQGQSAYPIIEWNSRSHVRPLFRGRKLIAAAFTQEIHREEINDQWTVYRFVEIQAAGVVRNLLYKGTPANLGNVVPLASRAETSTLVDQWTHDFGILCGRIPNKLGRDRRVGISDYRSVVELIFSLNEATTIGHENARLTAKKRVAVPREALNEDGQFDASEDVLVVDQPLDDQLGHIRSSGKFAVLEYSFDSRALIDHKLDLMSTILSRVGIVADFANTGASQPTGQGNAALSGTALRMRLIPTTLAANGKARFWDDALPKILLLAQQLDALDQTRGGFGRPWNQAADPPSIERTEPLPTDETEEVNRHVNAVAGEIESRKSAIADLHPKWDEEKVTEELDQIKSELAEFGAPTVPPPPGVQGGLPDVPGLPPGGSIGDIPPSA